MSLTKHLFISYAHLDDQPLTSEQEGWITRFHSSLEAFLSMRMGAKAEIWRDDRLQGNDVFAREIIDQFAQTAVLVSILTPRYIKSDWCTREVEEFCKSAQQTGGVTLQNKARVFKVIKTPVDYDAKMPSVLRDVLGYEFFTEEDGAPLELDPEDSPKDFKRKINKLAWDIAELLKQVQAGDSGAAEGGAEQATAKPVIFLGECSYDRKREREMIEGELRRHGYRVLPDQPLPREEDGYVAAVKELLERCDLAVHLVGESYGAVPDGPSEKSAAMLQNELAAQRSQSSGLPRVIWLPEGTKSDRPLQQEFIDLLHQDAGAQMGADLITGDLEQLKTSIHAALAKLEEPEPEQPAERADVADAAKLIYLICDEKDRKATLPLRKYCRAQGFEVAIPAFDGDATAIRAAHQQQMASCDAVILFYGAGDEAWKRTLDNERKKMLGYRGGKPLLASYTYLAAPETDDKEDLIEMEEPDLIDGLEGFEETKMTAFVRAMKAGSSSS